jgi:uncharacterized protein YndB with AHSA1/START domain
VTVNQGLAPIVKTVTVPAPPARAFEAFTAEMSAWWPLATHSSARPPPRAVRFEGAVGGKIVEHGDDGPLSTWGTVSVWDPPSTVSFTWHPGTDANQATRVTVRFSPVEGCTKSN